jgi:hypothetical protein
VATRKLPYCHGTVLLSETTRKNNRLLYLWNTDYSQREQFAVLVHHFPLFLAVFAGCSRLLLYQRHPNT